MNNPTINPDPSTLDPDSECADCGRMIEDKKPGICEYCNKRYQREAEIESIISSQPDIPTSDELDYGGPTIRQLLMFSYGENFSDFYKE